VTVPAVGTRGAFASNVNQRLMISCACPGAMDRGSLLDDRWSRDADGVAMHELCCIAYDITMEGADLELLGVLRRTDFRRAQFCLRYAAQSVGRGSLSECYDGTIVYIDVPTPAAVSNTDLDAVEKAMGIDTVVDTSRGVSDWP
jgi:hypothetical protein